MRRISYALIMTAYMITGFSTHLYGKDSRSIFNGQDLTGWHSRDQNVWRVEQGALTGGSLDTLVLHNSFLISDQSYQNFDLTLKIKLSGHEGFINSGIQVRSSAVPESHGMVGYQIDVGDGWWGKLYDEERRRKVIGVPADMVAVEKAVIKGGWNIYRIRCEGRHIQSWINGVSALDYWEKDLEIPQNGFIGIQVHGGGKALVQVKDVRLTILEETPDLPKW